MKLTKLEIHKEKMNNTPTLLWFNQIKKEDIADVGGKGANLGEMYSIKIPVPNGFVVTSQTYFNFINSNNLRPEIEKIIKNTNYDNPDKLIESSKLIKKIILSAPMDESIAIDIMKAYKKLSGFAGLSNVSVAVRSSATAEDLPDASFAGQQETFLNVIGEANLLNKVKACWASLFTPRAMFYRNNKKFNHFKVGIAVPIQKMVNADISGIMFTINPVTNNKSEVVVETAWGLGEYIVQGSVTPDQHLIDKTNWKVTSKHLSNQKYQLVRASQETKRGLVPISKSNKYKITDQMAIKIAKIGQKLHDHYAHGQDIEFAIEKGKIYIVQTRPITTLQNSQKLNVETNLPTILDGEAASPGIATGPVVIIKSPKNIGKAQIGQILVTTMTSPDFVPAMKKVAGIITDKGGQTSHAAIVSRELGTPCVVGTKNATKILKNGQTVTLDGATGKVWDGSISTQSNTQNEISLHQVNTKTATKLYVNLGEPSLSKDISKRNVDGIGLLRAEFMMAEIGIHPKRIIATNKQKEYINKLASSISTFCKNFAPRPVIYRATDFKTNEYRFLKWGNLYEPQEANPLLGFRGAIRYVVDNEVFKMELEALKKVRNQMGLRNLWLMVPFVRTTQELIDVKKIITDAGLIRSPSFKLFMMVEIPSNVLMLDSFIDIGIDGVSIGSNDLTMLTLGLDRDNGEVAKYFNEMDEAVLWSLKKIVTTCKKRNILCSICGQAPSNHPDLVEKLVKWGVNSISVSPDVIDHTRQIIAWAESRALK